MKNVAALKVDGSESKGSSPDALRRDFWSARKWLRAEYSTQVERPCS